MPTENQNRINRRQQFQIMQKLNDTLIPVEGTTDLFTYKKGWNDVKIAKTVGGVNVEHVKRIRKSTFGNLNWGRGMATKTAKPSYKREILESLNRLTAVIEQQEKRIQALEGRTAGLMHTGIGVGFPLNGASAHS